MPDYVVRDPATGRTVTLRGEQPPTEQELEQIFASLSDDGRTTSQAGDPSPSTSLTAPAASEEPGVGGFAWNTLSSAGRFLRDTAKGAVSLASLAGRLGRAQGNPQEMMQVGQDFLALVRNSPEIASQLLSALATRYGSTEAAARTLYEDPIGILSDISTIAGAGAALKLTKAPALVRLGTQAARVSELTNPVRLVTVPAAKTADALGTTAIAASLRPSAAIRREHGTAREIADAVKRERVFSEAQAQKKLTASTAEADRLLARAEAAGTPGVPSERLVAALEGEPSRVASLRADLGVSQDSASTNALIDKIRQRHTVPGTPGATPTIIDTPPSPDAVDAAIRATNELGTVQASQIPSAVFGNADPAAVAAVRQLGPQANLVPRRLLGSSQEPGRRIILGGEAPGTPTTMREIPLTRAQELKREAQTLAYERGLDNETIGEIQNRAIARALREAIEERVPEVGPVNERSQRLLGLQRAFEAAEDRPSKLGNMFAGLGLGGGLMAGDALTGLATAALTKAQDAPRFGAVMGIALDDLARMEPGAARTVLGSRAAERLLEQILIERMAGDEITRD